MWIPIFRQDRREPALLPSLDGSPPNDQLLDSIAFQLTIALLWFAFWPANFSRELSVPFVCLFLALLAAALILGLWLCVVGPVGTAKIAGWDNSAPQPDCFCYWFSHRFLRSATGRPTKLSLDSAIGGPISRRRSKGQTGHPGQEATAHGSPFLLVIVIFSIPFTIWLVHSALWGSIWVFRNGGGIYALNGKRT